MAHAEKCPAREAMRSDKKFMDGVRRGLEACKAGKVYPLDQVKRELGLK